MKILLIHNRYTQRGGEDTVFENEFSLLKNNGHSVESLTFQNKTGPGHFSKVTSSINSIFSIPSFVAACKKIRKSKPDLIHVHNLFYTASPSILWAAWLHKVPVILTLHNFRLLCPGALFLRNGKICEKCRFKSFPWPGIKYRCFKDGLLPSFTLAFTIYIHNLIGTWRKTITKYITLTPFSEKIFSDSALNLKPEQIVVKPNWTFPPTFNQTGRKKQHFLYVGRLSEEKGVSFLVKTFKQTDKKLHVIGDGPLYDILKEKSSKNISLLGKMPHEMVFAKIAETKAVFLPSCWYETFGMTIIEAFSVGTPVIASRIGGIPSIVQHGENGLLFEPNNEAELLDCINQLDDEHKYQQMSRAAKNSYNKHYNDRIALKNLIGIYEEAIQSNQYKRSKNS